MIKTRLQTAVEDRVVVGLANASTRHPHLISLLAPIGLVLRPTPQRGWQLLYHEPDGSLVSMMDSKAVGGVWIATNSRPADDNNPSQRG